MMKTTHTMAARSYPRIPMVVLASAFVLILAGCNLFSPPRNRMGTIEIAMGVSGAKTAHPFASEALMAVASYDVTLTAPDESVETLVAGKDGIVQHPEAMPGIWTISVAAKNADGRVLGRGTATVEVTEGAIASVRIEIRPSGSGTLRFTVDWSANTLVESSYQIKAYEVQEGEDPRALELSVDMGTGKASFETSIASGNYEILVRMADANDKVLWGQRESFYVYEGQATPKTFVVLPGQMNRRPETAPVIGAIERSVTRLAINWTSDSPRADQFTIERKSEPSGEWSQVGLVQYGTNRFIDSNIVQEAVYSYRIKAGNSFGDSEWSAIRQVTVPKVVSVFGANNKITTDTVWTSDNSYSVENLLIESGATLTIEKGTRVSFKVNNDPATPPFYMIVRGTLKAMGTAEEPVVFTTENPSPGTNSWGYIRFEDESVDASYDSSGNYVSGSILKNTVMEHSQGLYIKDSAPYVQGLAMRNCSTLSLSGEAGLGKTIRLNDLKFNGNGSGGGSIELAAASPVRVSNLSTSALASANISGDVEIVGSKILANSDNWNSWISATGKVSMRDSVIQVVYNGSFSWGTFTFDRVAFKAGRSGFNFNNASLIKIFNSNFDSGSAGLLGISSSSIDIQHTTFTGGNNGVSLSEVRGTMAYCTIQDASTEGLTLSGCSQLTLHHNTLRNNAPGKYAMQVSGSLSTRFVGNNLNNTGALRELRVSGSEDFSAGGNWWGGTSEETIATRIYDGNDTFNDGVASFLPFLTNAATEDQVFAVPVSRYGKAYFSDHPTVSWETVGGTASSYRIQLSDSQEFSVPLVDEETTATSHMFEGLQLNKIYYWRVAPLTGSGMASFGPSNKMPVGELRISAGLDNVFAKTDYSQYAWGYGYSYIFSSSWNGQSNSPMTFGWNKGFSSVEYGYHLTAFAGKSDGSLYAWGNGAHGNLGLGSENSFYEPKKIDLGKRVIDFDGGVHTGYAVLEDGSVWSWGYNNEGQLGDGTRDMKFSPVKVENLINVVAIDAQYNHVAAINSSGQVWAWGNNGNRQAGDNSQGSYQLAPQQIELPSKIEKVKVGDGFSIALDEGGKVFVWGNLVNNYYQATEITGLAKIVDIQAGGSHVVVLDSDGNVWSWGANWAGQLGTGDYNQRYSPTQVRIEAKVYEISAARESSYAVDIDGRVWAWGNNGNGQLGDRTTSSRPSPVEIFMP